MRIPNTSFHLHTGYQFYKIMIFLDTILKSRIPTVLPGTKEWDDRVLGPGIRVNTARERISFSVGTLAESDSADSARESTSTHDMTRKATVPTQSW